MTNSGGGELDTGACSHGNGPLIRINIRVGLLCEDTREDREEILGSALGEKEGLLARRGHLVLSSVAYVGEQLVLVVGNGAPIQR